MADIDEEPAPHVSIDEDLIGYTDWWLDASARRGKPIAGWITLIKRLRDAAAGSATPEEDSGD